MKRRSSGTQVGGSDLDYSAVGDGATVIHAEGGGIVHHYHGAGSAVPLRPREVARPRLPSTHDPCIGRDELLRRVWEGAQSVELSGPLGVGKTNLARHAAHVARQDWETVYYTDRADAVPDILLGILSCFFEWDRHAIPSSHTIAEELARRRALVVLDSSALGREPVEQVADVLGTEAFVIYSSSTPQLAAGSELVIMPGLDPDSAVELAVLRLGRPVDEDERVALRRFAVGVDGHPFTFLSAVLRLGHVRLTLEALTTQAQRQPELSDDDRLMLEILRCLGGAAIPIEELQALGASRGIAVSSVIERLDHEGLIERHSPRISIREDPDPDRVDKMILRDVLRHFAGAIERLQPQRAARLRAPYGQLWAWLIGNRSRSADDPVADTAEAILGSLRTGVAVGMWEDVHHAAIALIPVLGRLGLPGAWERATCYAVEASEHLNRPLDHARALQERACFLAVAVGPEAAASVFKEALARAENADAPELTTLITRNLEEVIGNHDTERLRATSADWNAPAPVPRRRVWPDVAYDYRRELLDLLWAGAALVVFRRRFERALALVVAFVVLVVRIRNRYRRGNRVEDEPRSQTQSQPDNRVEV